MFSELWPLFIGEPRPTLQQWAAYLAACARKGADDKKAPAVERRVAEGVFDRVALIADRLAETGAGDTWAPLTTMLSGAPLLFPESDQPVREQAQQMFHKFERVGAGQKIAPAYHDKGALFLIALFSRDPMCMELARGAAEVMHTRHAKWMQSQLTIFSYAEIWLAQSKAVKLAWSLAYGLSTRLTLAFILAGPLVQYSGGLAGVPGIVHPVGSKKHREQEIRAMTVWLLGDEVGEWLANQHVADFYSNEPKTRGGHRTTDLLEWARGVRPYEAVGRAIEWGVNSIDDWNEPFAPELKSIGAPTLKPPHWRGQKL